MLRTRFTEMLGLTYPIMSAPMTNHCGGTLASTVSRAGGLGSFGGINGGGPDWVQEQIAFIRSQTERPFAVGFINHLIPSLPDNFQAALDAAAPVIAFSFSDPRPWIGRARDSRAITICQVQTLEMAAQAVDAGADALVAQGNEAGGHTGGMNSLPFLAALLDRYPEVPVLAAGGIATGRALAAVLAAGADGAWVGTAFVATPEAVEVPEAFKQRIVASDGQDTAFTRLYDLLGDPPWPPGLAGRVYRNRFVREWDGRDEEILRQREELASDSAHAWEQQDPETASVYLGQSAASVTGIRPADRVLVDICLEAEELLARRSRELLG
ncbi:MAG: 2-nitropropane dioxygenase [SAR202 cluster bacterium Io17-Chloro-G9]|nr:MAG: 2-nitropropane dioxygenase [SAR202 cluster bacterium Io17-Chloro-G9]